MNKAARSSIRKPRAQSVHLGSFRGIKLGRRMAFETVRIEGGWGEGGGRKESGGELNSFRPKRSFRPVGPPVSRKSHGVLGP